METQKVYKNPYFIAAATGALLLLLARKGGAAALVAPAANGAGEIVPAGSSTIYKAQGVLKPTRNVRNNNPGNVRPAASGGTWQGQISVDAAGYVVFSSFKKGWRALCIILLNYQKKHGLKTIGQIINRYAPASDNNDPIGYASAVGKALNTTPTSLFNVNENLLGLALAIANHEGGGPWPAIDADRTNGISEARAYVGL